MPQKITTEKKSKERIYQIDLLRFLAAMSVVLFHYLFRGYIFDNQSNLQFIEIGKYFKYGYLGVDLFFIISGFVITLSIKSRKLKDFWISRISRLLPSYWLSILITASIIGLFGSPRFEINLKQIIINMTMFQNYFNVRSIDGVYWSLMIEMRFYIFIIGSYVLLNKIREIKLDYVIFSWLTLSITHLFLNHLLAFKILNYFLILDWSSYFIAGMIFYQIFKNKINAKYSILLCISISIALFNALSRVEQLELHYKTTFSPVFISGFIMLFYIIMLLVSCGKLQTINSPQFLKFGLLTYPLYLIHQKIGYIIFNNLGNESNKYLILFSTIISMLLVSYIISVLFEPRVSNYVKTKLKRFLKQSNF